MDLVSEYIYQHKQPYREIMIEVREVIYKAEPKITENFKYKIPFFMHQNKPMIYLNVLKGTNFVDVAFVQGVLLEEKYPQLKNYNNRKQVRSLQLKSLSEIDEVMLINLVKDAVIFIENSTKPWFI